MKTRLIAFGFGLILATTISKAEEDDSLRDFLKYEREDWEYRVKTCGN